MNRIDRVTAILIQLQSKKVVKASEIADRFSISLRTVYRDLKSLQEAGVPILGEAGIGYRIMEGYRLPPVMFTKEEAIACITAEKMMEKLTDPSSKKSFSEAMFKIKAVLRAAEKELAEQMEEYIEVIKNPYLPSTNQRPVHLQNILKAIVEKETLNLDYFSNHSQELTTRTVEPIGIFYLGNYWYMIAFCRLRKDYRTFRTDRIDKLQTTGKYFSQLHPSLKTFITQMSREREMHTVRIRVPKSILPFFGDQKYYNGFVSQIETGDNVEMTFVTASLHCFAKFYLLFGEMADIIAPVFLKDIVKQNLLSIQKKLE